MYNPNHRWYISFGYPYGTHKWKFGDSVYGNDALKTEETRQKRVVLVQQELINCNHLSLQKTNLIPIVNYSWDRSFGIAKNNQEAQLKRGWNHINRKLLVDPDAIRTKEDQRKTKTPEWSEVANEKKTIRVKDLNITEGFSLKK